LRTFVPRACSSEPSQARFAGCGMLVKSRFLSSRQSEGADAELYIVSSDGVAGHPVGINSARLAVSSRGDSLSRCSMEIAIFLASGNLARTFSL
jgi:hypothetical protein